MYAWSQSREVVVPFLLQNVWFDCREWSNMFLTISKNYEEEIQLILRKIPWNDNFPVTYINFLAKVRVLSLQKECFVKFENSQFAVKLLIFDDQ